MASSIFDTILSLCFLISVLKNNFLRLIFLSKVFFEIESIFYVLNDIYK